MKIKGSIQSIFTKLGYTWDLHGFELNFNTTIGDSHTKYYGSATGKEAGKRYSIPLNNIPQSDTFYSIEALYTLNLSYFLGYEHKMIGYVGFGYRSLTNKDNQFSIIYNDGSIPVSGDRRDQEYYYLPIGFYGKERLIGDLWARYALEARLMFYGKNKTQTIYNNVVESLHRYKQKNGYGFKAIFGFDYEILETVDVFIQATLDYWNIPQSSRVYISAYSYYIEPRNNTIQAGIEAGIRF